MAITSAPHESLRPQGRPDDRAARARTEEYYARYARTVGGLCRALLRDRTEAEDASQQVFLSAYRALLNGSVPQEPAAWLATIARNECWARVRSRMREPLATADLEETAARLPDPLAEAIRRADLAALWAAIEELPRQQRDALLLREFGGLSYDELAAALAVSTPAVESLLFRARSRLRTRLQAAYAAFSGASWLESLARLLAGSSPAVATKAVALGLGAAAVTGTAVVAPRIFEHPSQRAQRTRAATPAPAPAATQAAAASAPVVAAAVPHAARARPPLLVFRASRGDGRSSDGGDRSRQADTGARSEPRSGDGGGDSGGGGELTSTTERSSGDGGSSSTGDTQTSGGDGGGDTSTTTTPTDTTPTDTTSSQDGGGSTSNPSDGVPVVTVTVPVTTAGDG